MQYRLSCSLFTRISSLVLCFPSFPNETEFIAFVYWNRDDTHVVGSYCSSQIGLTYSPFLMMIILL